jgi:tetratricopeptide (TPR) repeat protein
MMLFTKTVEASNILYNRGLARAKTLDLTGAADCLMKSVQYNKDNYNARNLLGLIYFETGRMGDALTQWVISSSRQKKDNPAADYITETQKEIRTLEKYNDAIKMYNQALTYLKQKSDDMAIIQLKRAVELSPKFVDALNMMALCYLIQKDKVKSLAAIERVLAVDANNNTALSYYNEIFPAKLRPDPITKRPNTPDTTSNTLARAAMLSASGKKSFGEAFHIAEILSFIIGALCSFAVIYILMIPSMNEAWNTERTDLTAAAEATRTTLQDRININQADIARLTADNETLKVRNAELSAQVELGIKIQKINEADAMNQSGDLNGAAGLLLTLDAEGLPQDISERFNTLRADLFPRAAQGLYDPALGLFNAGTFNEGRDLFRQALLYNALDDAVTGDIHYYLGQIA